MKNRIITRQSQKQKFGIRTMIIVGASGTLLFLSMLVVMYYSDIRKAKAKASEFTTVEEQDFSNEMAIQQPYIRTFKQGSSEEILTKNLKSSPVSSNQNE